MISTPAHTEPCRRECTHHSVEGEVAPLWYWVALHASGGTGTGWDHLGAANQHEDIVTIPNLSGLSLYLSEQICHVRSHRYKWHGYV